MADYIRRTADPFLDDLDAETKEMMIGALEIACESREFETDEVEDIFVGSGCSSEGRVLMRWAAGARGGAAWRCRAAASASPSSIAEGLVYPAPRALE